MVPALDVELVARLWADGRTQDEINSVTGRTGAVARARRILGIERIPSHAVKKLPVKVGPVTLREMGRHLARRIGDEYIFRRGDGVEEVWKQVAAGDDGIRGPHHQYFRFIQILGMTEPRTLSPAINL